MPANGPELFKSRDVEREQKRGRVMPTMRQKSTLNAKEANGNVLELPLADSVELVDEMNASCLCCSLIQST